MKIRSFVAWLPRDGSAVGDAEWVRSEGDQSDWRLWKSGALRVRFSPRATTSPPAPPHARLPTLILGDDGDWDAAKGDANMASGVPIRYDEKEHELIVSTSIVALPPVFLYRGPHVVALTSDLYLLAGIPGVRLELDS